jgi:hypothetical protein
LTWLEKRHRCARPSLGQVEAAAAGIGSRWQCPEGECGSVYRLADFELTNDGLAVRWEIER